MLPSRGVGSEVDARPPRVSLSAADGFGRMDSEASGGSVPRVNRAVRAHPGPEVWEGRGSLQSLTRWEARQNLGGLVGCAGRGSVMPCACDWEDRVGEAAISGVKYGLPVLSGEGGVVTLGMCCANLSPRVWSSLLPLLPSDKFLWYDRGRRMWCSSYSHDVFNSMFSSLRVNFRA